MGNDGFPVTSAYRGLLRFDADKHAKKSGNYNGLSALKWVFPFPDRDLTIAEVPDPLRTAAYQRRCRRAARRPGRQVPPT
jgi:hypothetical protein